MAKKVIKIARQGHCKFIKKTGDGFLMTFPESVNAVVFAVDAIKVINKYNLKMDSNEYIHFSFGINYGETMVEEKGGRLGMAVNMAMQIERIKPDGLIPIENGMTKKEMPLENRIMLTDSVENEIKNKDKFLQYLLH